MQTYGMIHLCTKGLTCFCEVVHTVATMKVEFLSQKFVPKIMEHSG